MGSERGTIETLIARAAKHHAATPDQRPVIRYVDDQVKIDGGSDLRATVWLAVFDAQHETAVERGENAGRRLNNVNVVKEWRELGHYAGQPLSIVLDLDDLAVGQQGCAVLVQRETANGLGPVVSAVVLDPPGGKK